MAASKNEQAWQRFRFSDPSWNAEVICQEGPFDVPSTIAITSVNL